MARSKRTQQRCGRRTNNANNEPGTAASSSSNNNAKTTKKDEEDAAAAAAAAVWTPRPLLIQGTDDCGGWYDSHDALRSMQNRWKDVYYHANDEFWQNSGYGGTTDDECMVGDTDGIQDGVEGLHFLDCVMLAAAAAAGPGDNTSTGRPATRTAHTAIDVGAGFGRITKYILLKRFSAVRLIEGDAASSQHSKQYLGHKRASRCIFTNMKLQHLTRTQVAEWPRTTVIWIQWTLQYLTDDDCVSCLQTLATGLAAGGFLIVKENRPYGTASSSNKFQMDVPSGASGRYDITRPDAHHRILFQLAGLRVQHSQQNVETNTYALMNIRV